jgi:pimeloyl-ACP methyl ester carboxylesterase
MTCVTSRDATRIAFERSGSGPVLVVVDGALCSRAFGPSAKIAAAVAKQAVGKRQYTVYRYDRRGRGESNDTSPYLLEREIEDLEALIRHAGGPVTLLGLSSGGALALHAAAAGLPIDHVIAYEPPYVHARGGAGGAEYEDCLRTLVAEGDRAGAVTYFMRDMVGAPAFVPIMMRMMPWVWRKLKSVAHTLPYDAAIMTEFRVPRMRFASVRTPVLVLNGSKTDARLKTAARVVAESIPGAQHRELPGQSHNVNPHVLVEGTLAFLADSARAGRGVDRCAS